MTNTNSYRTSPMTQAHLINDFQEGTASAVPIGSADPRALAPEATHNGSFCFFVASLLPYPRVSIHRKQRRLRRRRIRNLLELWEMLPQRLGHFHFPAFEDADELGQFVQA